MGDCLTGCLEELRSGQPNEVLRVYINNMECYSQCEADRQCLIRWIGG